LKKKWQIVFGKSSSEGLYTPLSLLYEALCKFFLTSLFLCLWSPSGDAHCVYAYEEAKPILETLAEIIPAELRDARAGTREEVWNAWVIKRDKEIRARLAQGDADFSCKFLDVRDELYKRAATQWRTDTGTHYGNA